MFRRTIAQAAQSASSPVVPRDKMLPLIPFTPDWSQSAATTGHPAPGAGNGDAQKPQTADVNHLP